MKNPACEHRAQELASKRFDNLADAIAHHARVKPGEPALIEHDSGAATPWLALDRSIDAMAATLLDWGLQPGNVLATSLPFTREHVILLYACFRTGIIAAPLDLRLRPREVEQAFAKMCPRAYIFLGRPGTVEFAPAMTALMAANPGVAHWVQVQREAEGVVTGARHVATWLAAVQAAASDPSTAGRVAAARAGLGPRTPCLIIFTTGSTGSPKPALLCHENILLQNIGLMAAFRFNEGDRMLVNLPPSHVGGVTEQLATTLVAGGTAVLLPIFDPARSLEAIARHRVTLLGQIPAMFAAEWRLSSYSEYDLSSLRMAIYGGQAVSVEFLRRLATMAPGFGTGLGLTELAGFCTYTDLSDTVEEIAAGIGHDTAFCPISIREPMRPDGHAGTEVPAGQVGEVCFAGPQVFLGYLNDPESTAQTISRDGICYTGDLGSYTPERGLRFAGRAKLVIKPKGFQVNPLDVEALVQSKLVGRVAAVACVGAEHDLFTEAVMLFVEVLPGHEVTVAEVGRACKDIASYARPSHVELVGAGEIPLNRVAKTDYMALRERAASLVSALRSAGKWDRRGR